MNNDGRVAIEVDLQTKQFEEQINYLETKLNDMLSDYETMSQEEGFNEQSFQASKLRQEIERVSNQIAGLRQQQIKLEQTSTKSWDKVLRNLKRVGLRMLGIASAYGIISRASSSYLSQDTELAEKLRSVWVALGSYLQPVIEGFSNMMLKAVGYLNTFITALTGVDYIANANAKALQKQAKATKELNNQMYDFDVIRTQKDMGTGTDTSKDLISIPELDQRIVTKLQEMAYWLKENWTWVEAVGISLATVFGIAAINNLLNNISLLIGSAAGLTGLSGLAYLLATLAAGVLIVVTVEGIVDVIRKFQELNAEIDKYNKNTAERKSRVGKVVEHALSTKDQKEIDEVTKYLEQLSSSTYKSIEKGATDPNSTLKMRDALKKELELIHDSNEAFKLLDEQVGLTDEQKQRYKESLVKEMEATILLDGSVEDLRKQYEKIDGKEYHFTTIANFEIDDEKAKKKMNWWQILLNSIGLGATYKTTKSAQVAFAQGGIVTQPTRAIIGEGGYPEAVLPMTDDYLSTLAQMIGQYGGNNGGTTNVYLDGRLIQRQIANREKEVRFATNK